MKNKLNNNQTKLLKTIEYLMLGGFVEIDNETYFWVDDKIHKNNSTIVDFNQFYKLIKHKFDHKKYVQMISDMITNRIKRYK
jgi:hypothetical protein